MIERQRKFWGWGYETGGLSENFRLKFMDLLKVGLGIKQFNEISPPKLNDIHLRPPRISLPEDLLAFCTDDVLARVSHCYGKSYQDVMRALRGRFDNPPDLIAYPQNESEIVALMRFCEAEQIALIPYGGGTSVVGGVEPTRSEQYQGVITVNLKAFDRILEVDTTSRCARVQAGILGPALEAGLKPHGLTLRHFPQSFEFSSLGGWIATRAGGHFATLYTHIDDLVEAVRLVTPKGILQTRRLPASGAGPSAKRLVLGSEGILGIITEAWVRLQPLPVFKVSVSVKFQSTSDGVQAVRALSQSGLFPSNCRLVSPLEALSMGLGDGQHTILLLGFESHDHPLDAWLNRALSLCAQFNGQWDINTITGLSEQDNKPVNPADSWKRAFFQAPYLRDYLATLGLIVETFETAITWDRFETFHQDMLKTVQRAIKVHCGIGFVTWRFTHVYPDGPAVYYTVIALGEVGQEIEQWANIKKAASDAILAGGGTITHHHAVGKEHQPWYKAEQSPLFANVLHSAKQTLDPHWILNPDVLLSGEAEI